MNVYKTINDLTIKRKLGSGNAGTVYLASHEGNDYALKIEYLSEIDCHNDSRSTVWREINFAINFAARYPNNFMKFYGWDIVDNYQEERTNNQKYFDIRRKKTKLCSRKVYSLVDGELDPSKLENDIKRLYSMIMQLSYMIHLLQEDGYVHGAFNGRNIGIIHTNEKYMRIFDYDIPLFGIKYVLIDFGNHLHHSYDMNDSDEKRYDMLRHTELDGIFFDYILSDMPHRDRRTKKDIHKTTQIIKGTHEFEIICDITDDPYHRIMAYQILYPEQYQRLLYGKNTKILYHKYLVPLSDILYYITSKRDVQKIIRYFYEKLI